ncbi:alpha/beta hydrolase [Luteibacter aegosomatis]|uniref:alpha/beta fold hydrolase n=1 Tax=Luteibacter aegosomatis TaxID=2911537 RepID=UPI001FFA2804|nr:alpha/beta hydrolase [Luteibacter aegosomatis]UPG84614.1 alpha/beta hydrolase [Luteibacter aegosomatis]
MRLTAILLAIFTAAADASATDAVSAGQWEGDVDVGGRSIHLSCEGKGDPVAVIDAGMGTAPVEDQGWQRIAHRVAAVTTVCLYDRAGQGASSKAPPGPRTSMDSANDLHAALGAAHVRGPYLLVGHSIGGLHAQVFASRYPNDTAGLVLVSSTHPDQTRTWLSLLPPPARDENKSITEARDFLTSMASDPSKNPEMLDFAASATQAKALRSLGSKPVVVATHSPRFRMVPGLPEPLAVKLEDATQRMQKQFLSLSSDSHQNIAATAGHGLPHEDPSFVVDNILQAVTLVRRDH